MLIYMFRLVPSIYLRIGSHLQKILEKIGIKYLCKKYCSNTCALNCFKLMVTEMAKLAGFILIYIDPLDTLTPKFR